MDYFQSRWRYVAKNTTGKHTVSMRVTGGMRATNAGMSILLSMSQKSADRSSQGFRGPSTMLHTRSTNPAVSIRVEDLSVDKTI